MFLTAAVGPCVEERFMHSTILTLTKTGQIHRLTKTFKLCLHKGRKQLLIESSYKLYMLHVISTLKILKYTDSNIRTFSVSSKIVC